LFLTIGDQIAFDNIEPVLWIGTLMTVLELVSLNLVNISPSKKEYIIDAFIYNISDLRKE
jgi:hypothetical protein